MNAAFLDKTLLHLKLASNFISDIEDKSQLFPKDEGELSVRALKKLEKDGYAYTELTEKPNYKSTRFFLSYDGLLALENCPFFWKNRPYTWKKDKQTINLIWQVSKTIAVVANAIAVMVFTYLTYINR